MEFMFYRGAGRVSNEQNNSTLRHFEKKLRREREIKIRGGCSRLQF